MGLVCSGVGLVHILYIRGRWEGLNVSKSLCISYLTPGNVFVLHRKGSCLATSTTASHMVNEVYGFCVLLD